MGYGLSIAKLGAKVYLPTRLGEYLTIAKPERVLYALPVGSYSAEDAYLDLDRVYSSVLRSAVV